MATQERTGLGDLIYRLVDLGLGAAVMTRDAVERAVDELVKRGEMSRDDARRFADELMDKGEQQRARTQQMVDNAVSRMLERMDLARHSELTALQTRINQLESRLARLEMEEPGVVGAAGVEEGL